MLMADASIAASKSNGSRADGGSRSSWIPESFRGVPTAAGTSNSASLRARSATSLPQLNSRDPPGLPEMVRPQNSSSVTAASAALAPLRPSWEGGNRSLQAP